MTYESKTSETEIPCPFCNEGKIKSLYTPIIKVTKFSRAASNKKATNYFKPEKYVILSGCPICHKTKKEIEKRLKEGKQPSREEVLRRMKEAGLPTKF